MNNSNINDLKEKLYQYEKNIDTDALWSVVEKHIPEKEKKNNYILWFLFGIIGIGSLFFISDLSSHETTNNDKSVNAKKEISPNRVNNSVVESLSKENENRKELGVKASINKNENNHNTEQITKQEVKNMHTQSINASVPHYTIETNNSVIQTSSNHDLNTLWISGEKGQENKIEKNNLPDQIQMDDSVAAHNKSVTYEMATTMLPMLYPSLSYQEEMIRMSEVRLSKKPFLKSTWLKLNMTAGKVATNYRSDEENDYWAEAWNDYSKALPALGLSLYYGADVSRKWSIFSGITYDRYVTRININRDFVVEHYESGTVKTIIDEDGNKTNISGKLKTSTAEKYKANWHTYHQQISLPIGIEYNFLNTNRMRVKMILGANITLASIQNGAILNEDFKIGKFTSTNSPYQVNPFNISLGSEVEYFIKREFSLSLGMRINSSKNRINLEDKTLHESLHSLNSTVSIKHIF